MGFGLICAGYTTLLFLRLIPAELIGFAVIYLGLGKLAKYNRFFKYALYACIAMIAFSVIDAVFWALKLAGITNGIQWLESVLSYLHMFLLLPFHFFLFRGLRTISEELGFEKGVRRSALAMSVTAVYFLVFAISCISTPIGAYIDFAALIMFFINFIATESAVHCCYRAITTDEAEQKEEDKLKKFEQQFGRRKKDTKPKK